jgi:hypothetical protein
MISHNELATDELLFRVPFGHVTTWREFVEDYPAILNEMTGEDVTCMLGFYYQLNPLTFIYEFHDENAENDIAECIGISLDIIQNGEKDDEKKQRQDHENSIHQSRSLEAFLYLEDEQDRNMFLHSSDSIDDFLKKHTPSPSLSIESSSFFDLFDALPSIKSKEDMKREKKQRREEKLKQRVVML